MLKNTPPIKGLKNQLKTNGCGFLVLLVIGIGITLWIITLNRYARAAAPFKVIQTQLRGLCQVCNSQLDKASDLPVIGRVVVVDSTGTAIGSVMANKRLAGIKASQPSEVVTIIFIGDKSRVQTGRYSDGSEAYTIHRTVCIIDYQTDKVLYRNDFHGSKPPSSKSGAGSEDGSDPLDSEIIDLIQKLPAK